MRWDQIAEIIKQPYSVLIEIYITKTKYFLFQNKAHYEISVAQFKRILQTNTLNTNYTVSTLNGIEERLYKSKFQ